MSERPRLFVELCCGSAAVTLRLLGGAHAKPPISYMGSKRGYAHAILAAMGLRSGEGADAVLLCDAGPWAHVWSVLADPARCAEVARILRSWSDEDPRALWERLRDEHRGEWDGWTAERAAGWVWLEGRSYNTKGPDAGFTPDVSSNGVPVWGALPVEEFARRVESVAAWTFNNCLESVFVGTGKPRPPQFDPRKARGNEESPPLTCDSIASRVYSPAPLSVYAGPAEDIEPPEDCEGVYVYIDPPYQGTTGYAADMPRETVLEVARRWSDAGAVVCVSEAVPLPLDGWHHVDIGHTRIGQKRTFGATNEWLTMNRKPACSFPKQIGLFDGA